MKEEKLLTTRQVADRLGVSLRTVKRYMLERDLKFTKYQYFDLIREEDLNDFIDRSVKENRLIKATRPARKKK